MTLGTFTPKKAGRRIETIAGNCPESIDLQRKIVALVTDASNGAARNLQKAIGPSEIGHPCPRNVAYKVAGVPKQPNFQDPLPSVLGVAFHTWMETHLPRDEWIPESRVHVTSTLAGHSDAYHRPTRTVVDWKLLGRTIHSDWTGGYVSDQYRVQAHSYGLGFYNAGFPVDRVAVAVFCRAKPLADLYVWSEPWDYRVAQQAIDRLEIIRSYVNATGAGEHNVMPLREIPAVAGGGCYFCPYKGDPSAGFCERSGS